MSTREQVRSYLERSGWTDSPERVEFLAAGEYNENFLVHSPRGRFVLRINHGSQLGRSDQVEYEFTVLKAVEPSGVTPRVFFVDPNPQGLEGGALLMEYLPGEALDYSRDKGRAARVFARIHALPAAEDLIVQSNPVAAIASESYGLVNRYPDHPRRVERAALLRYHERIQLLAESVEALFANERLCIVNTEVNSGNFIVQPDRTCLVDWEKAVVSCRYQDLGHFVAPTTTLWKSDYLYSEQEKRAFLKEYRRSLEPGLELDELYEKTKVLERTILLRGLSWCYMAYYEYTQAERSLRNADTFARIRSYLDNINSLLIW